MKELVFLGGGRITSALVAGLRRAAYQGPLVVHDRNPGKLEHLEKKYDITAELDLRRAAERAGLLLIAVRPRSVGELLRQLGKVHRRVVAVSLAAGIPLATLKQQLGAPVVWARAMPSPVCRSGRGLTGLAFSPAMKPGERSRIKRLFQQVGGILEIPEEQFDAFTVTYSPSHGYHALATLAGAAERSGLDPRSSLTAAAHALADAIVSWREGGASLEDLLHEAATPGGTAAASLLSLDKAGFARILERALRAGMKQARANAKSSRAGGDRGGGRGERG